MKKIFALFVPLYLCSGHVSAASALSCYSPDLEAPLSYTLNLYPAEAGIASVKSITIRTCEGEVCTNTESTEVSTSAALPKKGTPFNTIVAVFGKSQISTFVLAKATTKECFTGEIFNVMPQGLAGGVDRLEIVCKENTFKGVCT